MNRWERRNERLDVANREEKLEKCKEKNAKIREARDKVENMTEQQKVIRQQTILEDVRIRRERAAARRKKEEDLKKSEALERLQNANHKLRKWRKSENE